MPHLHLDSNDLAALLDGETIQHPVTGLRVSVEPPTLTLLQDQQSLTDVVALLRQSDGVRRAK